MAVKHADVHWAYAVIFDDLHACGCGFFSDRLELLRGVLNERSLYNSQWADRQTPLGEWFLCLLDGAELMEHGSSIGYSWLTDKGERFLEILNNEESWKLLIDGAFGYSCSECPTPNENGKAKTNDYAPGEPPSSYGRDEGQARGH